MYKTRIRRLAARWVLDLLDPNEAIDLAHSLLDQGTYTYSLGELATTHHWEPGLFERLFRSAVRELGCEMPDEEGAFAIYLADHLGGVYEGRELPQDLFSACASLRWSKLDLLTEAAECAQLYQWFLYWDDAIDLADVMPPEEPVRPLYDGALEIAETWLPHHFRAAIRPEDRTANVIAIAQAINAERAFDRLPILADALEDAGCTNADVLEHCRQPGEHARGCWVVDLLLGRS